MDLVDCRLSLAVWPPNLCPRPSNWVLCQHRMEYFEELLGASFQKYVGGGRDNVFNYFPRHFCLKIKLFYSSKVFLTVRLKIHSEHGIVFGLSEPSHRTFEFNKMIIRTVFIKRQIAKGYKALRKTGEKTEQRKR